VVAFVWRSGLASQLGCPPRSEIARCDGKAWMRWLVSLSFLLIGLVCGAGSVLYLLQNKAAETDDITFAPKAFFDNDASINISGTMTGDSLAYPNNTFSIGCYKDQKLC
jgi:hypothetical protein